MTATAQGEAARDAVAFRGTTPVIDGPLMGHERCHVETLWRFLGMLHSSPKSGIATSRSSCAVDLHQKRDLAYVSLSGFLGTLFYT